MFGIGLLIGIILGFIILVLKYFYIDSPNKSKLEVQLKNLEREKDSLQQENGELKLKVDALNSEARKSKQDSYVQSESLEDLQDKISDLEANVSRLEKLSHEKQTTINELRTINESLNVELGELKK